MKYFRTIHEGLDTSAINAELAASPDLWDAHKDRTSAADGVMAGTSDIWIRYFPRETLTEPAAYLKEGRCVFYPAWFRLPSIQPVVFTLMGMFRGVELGGCLISRLPPGGVVKPHSDGAAWSANFYNRKFYCILDSNPDCLNVTEDEQIVLPPGSVTLFDNLSTHAVYNRGQTERINLIITLRSEE